MVTDSGYGHILTAKECHDAWKDHKPGTGPSGYEEVVGIYTCLKGKLLQES